MFGMSELMARRKQSGVLVFYLYAHLFFYLPCGVRGIEKTRSGIKLRHSKHRLSISIDQRFAEV